MSKSHFKKFLDYRMDICNIRSRTVILLFIEKKYPGTAVVDIKTMRSETTRVPMSNVEVTLRLLMVTLSSIETFV